MQRLVGFPVLSFVLAVTFLSGCGGDSVGYVSGKVILASEESAEGLYVMFMNTSTGVGATSVVDADGNYSLMYKGGLAVPVGTFGVAVKAHEKEMSQVEFDKYIKLPLAKKEKVQAKRLIKGKLVPKKYHDPSTSGLSYEITPGNHTYDIDVSK